MPECGGDLLRINYIARYLKSQGHRLTLVSYYENAKPDVQAAKTLYDQVYVVKRHRWWSAFYSALFLLKGLPIQCGYYYSRNYNQLFKKVSKTEKPDLYISHLLRMVPFLENQQLHDKSIVEMTDALSKTYSLSSGAKGNRLLRTIYKVEKRLIAQYERYVIEHYKKVVLVSQADIDYLQKGLSTVPSSMALHTNGVECHTDEHNDYDTLKICFIGHMQSLQNQDAAIHFVNDIFPLILQKQPQARFYIVGAHPPKNIQKLHNGHNIFVTGFVDDLNSFVSDACVAVAPVQIAAGIQNKVLVAMGCNIPVVLTPLIAQSIPELTDGKNCYIKKDSREFADCCLKIMSDKDLRNKIAQQGNAMVHRYYSWHEKLKGYEVMPTR